MEESEKLNQITERVIGAAIAVHRALGQQLSRFTALPAPSAVNNY